MMNKEEESNELAELFMYECTLNTLICEYHRYEPTKEVASKMFDLNHELLDAMNARKKELGVTEHYGYCDEYVKAEAV
jgi:hypothetical protein